MANENQIFARFYNHTVLNEGKSKEAGRPIYDDVEVCELRFAGNKQTVHVAPAHEVFRTERNFATGEVTPVTYALAYKDQYMQFKNNEAQEQSGTPLSELPFLTQAKRLELKALNIHTAEALAGIDGQPLKRLGMGGRELKNQAQAYLDNARGSVDVTTLAARIAALEEENAKLKGVSSAPSGETETVGVSPFMEMEADDIRNWIEASGGQKPRANASHASLVKIADDLNAELARKAQQVAA